MKIIEGLKELKRIDRELKNDQYEISEESVVFAKEKEEDKEKQTRINELRDSSLALTINYLNIKHQIAVTNLSTKVTYDEKEYSLSELIHLRDFGIPRQIEIYHAFLNNRIKKTDDYKRLVEDLMEARSRFEAHGKEEDRKEIKNLQAQMREYSKVRYFVEEDIEKNIKKLREKINKINDLLDGMNIKTDLTESK